MIDKKDPRQDSDNDDSSDDEVIIDLTEEVVVEPGKDRDAKESSRHPADVDGMPPTETSRASKAGEDQHSFGFDEAEESDSTGADAGVDLFDQAAEDAEDPFENQLIASAIEDSLGADEDEGREITEEFDLDAADDDDIITMDLTPAETEENFSTSGGDEIVEGSKEEDLFDLEEEIELEYDFEDEENDEIDLDDKDRGEEDQDFANLVLGGPRETSQDDEQEVNEYYEFEAEGLDSDISADPGKDENTEVIALTEEDDDNDELPDLELDFEDEEDTVGSPEVDELETDSGDDITARVVEQSVDPEMARHPDAPSDDAVLEFAEDEELPELIDPLEADGEFLDLSEDETLKFDSDNERPELDDDLDLDLDDDNEVIPLDGLNGIDTGDDDDIIEITEFDEHFPVDGEALLKQTGFLDGKADDEDDYLELIDVDDEGVPEDEELVEFSDMPAGADDEKLDRFFSEDLLDDSLQTPEPESVFNDELEDRLLQDEFSESIFNDEPETRAGFGEAVMEDEMESGEKETEPAPESETTVSEDEDFDINYDAGEIAQQVDRLDTFLYEDSTDEPVVASLDVNRDEEEETDLQESQTSPEPDESLPIPPGQIDAAIERVINEKFSGKIEEIIYEVIEKAVAKEIDRLKDSLTGNSSIDDEI